MKHTFSQIGGTRLPTRRAPPKKAETPIRERYRDLMRHMEVEMPFLKGLSENQACVYGGAQLKFGLDEEAKSIRMKIEVGKPSEADELSVLRNILAMHLTQPTPAFWVAGWDPELGVVLSAHFDMAAETPNQLMTFGIQLEVCVQMAVGMRKQLLGLDS